ncbi:MAG TPA: class I SAM-dependent methyltransferase [Armatimonadota bacterium]|jgi:ubiquinone/menaquinone biosynthesis C-methylase UbiE
MTKATEPGGGRVCSAQHAGLLVNSLRRLVHNPERMLAGLAGPGDTVVDLGCGPGWFTLPLARLVGDTGRVIAVDLQEEMLEQVRDKAAQAGLADRIQLQRCTATEIGVTGPVDFALAFYMVHEAPDVEGFLGQVYRLLRPEGRLLLAEPPFHVTATQFARTVELARAAGFWELARPRITFSRAVLLGR